MTVDCAIALKEDKLPSAERLAKGPVAIIECPQCIPCNPCADACPVKAITIRQINDCPSLDAERCNGCGMCMAHCPGLSIFVVDYTYQAEAGVVKIPYEFLPLPKVKEKVMALNRVGADVVKASVLKVQSFANKTSIIWLLVPKEKMMDVRALRLLEGGNHE